MLVSEARVERASPASKAGRLTTFPLGDGAPALTPKSPEGAPYGGRVWWSRRELNAGPVGCSSSVSHRRNRTDPYLFSFQMVTGRDIRKGSLWNSLDCGRQSNSIIHTQIAVVVKNFSTTQTTVPEKIPTHSQNVSRSHNI